MSENERLEGKITYVNDTFGFIDKTHHFWISDVERSHVRKIKAGRDVSYLSQKTEKGYSARSVQIMGMKAHNGEYRLLHHTELDDDNFLLEIQETLANMTVIIIDSDPLPFANADGSMNQFYKGKKKIKTKLRKKFDGFDILEADILPKGIDEKRRHPYLFHACSSVHIILANECAYSETNDEKLLSSFAKYLYKRILEKHRNAWMILGDETGDLAEFLSKKPRNPAAMCWIVVPPNTNLPSLNPMFHIHDNPEEMLTAMKNITNHPDVSLFQFQYQSGDSIDGTPTGEAHLNFWKDTLPLVINHIAEQTKGGKGSIPVRIFLEQVGGLEANTRPLAGSISEWKQSMDNSSRHGWQHLNIVEAKVLAKKPLEHPWLGYPDAIGFMRSPRKWDDETQASIEAALPQLRQVPYIQNALKTCNDLFLSSDSGVSFLRRLFDLSVRDVETYIRTFYSGQLQSIMSSLTAREWRELLELMQDRSEYRKEQNAIALMFEHTDVEATLQNITLDAYKFEFNMALLGSSNHTGDTTTAQTCKSRIEALFDGGYSPLLHRRRHYQNLSNGSNDNEFDFSLDEADLQELLESLSEHGVQNKEEGKLAGAYALTLALQGEADSLETATMIETYLREHSANDPFGGNHARRLNLQAELLLESGDVEKARNLMMTEIPDIVERDFRDLLREDGFFMASFLKACALSGSDQQLYEIVSTYVPALLNDHHPSQRIAFWTVEWARRIGNSEGETFDRCLEHLRHMQALEIFQKEAPGVILACEVLHLEAHGFDGFEAKSFFESVIANSSATTKLWVEQHPPNDEDWLAPLNFNYR